MPKRVIPLTDVQVRNAKRRERAYKLADGGGLYLEVMPNGAKYWRLKYRRDSGKENRLALGSYPEVSLNAARDKRNAARKQLAEGLDPGLLRAVVAQQAKATAENSFEHVARAWHATMVTQWQPQTAANILDRLSIDIFPSIGSLPIADVGPQELLAAIRKVESRGALEIAKRLNADCGRIFRYAAHCQLTDRNPTAYIREVLEPRIEGHFAAIGADDLPKFLKIYHSNQACLGPITHIAMGLMLLVFVRTSELISALEAHEAWEEKSEA